MSLVLRNTKGSALTFAEMDSNWTQLGNVSFGLGTLASASTCDIGSVAAASLLITGTTTIISFGNSLAQGASKRLYIQSQGLQITPSANLLINISFLSNSPQFAPYISQVNDELIVTCIGTASGNNVYRVTINSITGISPSYPGITSKNIGLSANASGTILSVFCQQITLSDWQSQLQGGSSAPHPAYGAMGNSKSIRLVNVGNSGNTLLTCDISKASQLGGTDGSSFSNPSNWFFYLVSDGIGSQPTVGIIASSNTTTPQGGFSATYPYGCLVATNYYSTILGTPQLYPTTKTGDWVSFTKNSAPTVFSGQSASGGTAWTTITYMAGGLIPNILINSTDPYLYQVTGSGTGRVRLACDSATQATPNFDFTGDGTHPWTFTVYVPSSEAQLDILSSDLGCVIKLLGAIDQG